MKTDEQTEKLNSGVDAPDAEAKTDLPEDGGEINASTVCDGQSCESAGNAQNVSGEPSCDGEVQADESTTDDGFKTADEQADDGRNAADGQTAAPPKKRKYGWLGTLFLVAVIALGIFLMFKIVADMGDEVKSFDDVLAASDWRFALVSLSVIIVIFICIGLEYSVVMKATTGKLRLRAGIKVALIGKFYDNITPFATGGQPMQILYLNKKGLHGGVSSAVVLIKYFAWMFCWLLISLIFMASCTGVVATHNTSSRLLLLIAGWIGLFVNMLLPVVLILFVVLPRFSRAVTSLIIRAGCKIKIVKDKQRAMDKLEKIVSDFRSSFALMSRRPVEFIILIALCLTEIFLTFSFPYFVMKMFSGLGADDGISVMFTVAALNIYATMSASVVPTPGNSGAIEGLVTAAFSAVAGSVLLWTVFVWRFGVYYIYIIIGLLVTVYDFIRRLVRRRRSNKNNG